jgi:hypothetical protein
MYEELCIILSYDPNSATYIKGRLLTISYKRPVVVCPKDGEACGGLALTIRISLFAPKIGKSGLTGQTCGSHMSDCCS